MNMNDRVQVIAGAKEVIGFSGTVEEVEKDLLVVALDEAPGSHVIVFDDEVKPLPSWEQLRSHTRL